MQTNETGQPVPDAWHVMGVILLIGAAALPINCCAIRAWFSAHELPRSASLFEAKNRAFPDGYGFWLISKTIRRAELKQAPYTVLYEISPGKVCNSYLPPS